MNDDACYCGELAQDGRRCPNHPPRDEPKERRYPCMGSHETGPCVHPRHDHETDEHVYPRDEPDGEATDCWASGCPGCDECAPRPDREGREPEGIKVGSIHRGDGRLLLRDNHGVPKASGDARAWKRLLSRTPPAEDREALIDWIRESAEIHAMAGDALPDEHGRIHRRLVAEAARLLPTPPSLEGDEADG